MASRISLVRRLALCSFAMVAGGVAWSYGDEPKTAPKPAPIKAVADTAAQTTFINEQLAKAWKDNKITKSPRSDNYEFCRRVFLDLIGRIPKPDEVQAFVNSGANRRALIQKLLHDKAYQDDYVRHWANVWTTWLLTRTGNPTYREQMHLWLEDCFAKNISHKDMAIALITATGKTNENQAVNYILSHLGERTADGKEAEEGHFEMVPITSRTTRLFLGLQTQCVQCHDHPFNPEWKQSAFWGVNVFFRQVARGGNPMMRQNQMMNTAPVLTLKDDPEVNKDGIVYYERRNGMILPTTPMFLDGTKPEPSTSRTRREQFAELMVKNDGFGKAYVNRIWGHLFGRGLCEQPAVDDFGEHNKVVHPELLDRLGKDFAEYAGHNPKELLAWICNSDAYQSTSVANNTNDKPETDVFFSRMMLKAMSPEQLYESLWIATRGQKADSVGDAEATKKRQADWTKRLVANFGDDEGNEVAFNGTVVQALLMMNGKDINEEIRNPAGTVVKALKDGKASHGAIVNSLYMAALSRPANGNEPGVINRVATKTGGKMDATFYADVMWALLNSNEFILNH